MNKFKNVFKRYPRQVIAVILASAMLFTGALAFLSASDEKSNIFVLGKIDVELWEELDVNLDDSIDPVSELFDATNASPPSVEGVITGKIIKASPYVINTGDNNSWVYITVGIPCMPVATAVSDEDTIQSLEGKAPRIDIKGYAFQENIVEGNNLEDMWNAYSSGDERFSVSRTSNQYVPVFEIQGIDETNWSLVKVVNSTYAETLDNITYVYDYYVYGYNTVLSGNNDKINAITGGMTQAEADALAVTSKLFESFKLINITTKTFSSFIENGGKGGKTNSYGGGHPGDGHSVRYSSSDVSKAVNRYTIGAPAVVTPLGENASLKAYTDTDGYLVFDIILADGSVLSTGHYETALCLSSGSSISHLASWSGYTGVIQPGLEIRYSLPSQDGSVAADALPYIMIVVNSSGTFFGQSAPLDFKAFTYKNTAYSFSMNKTDSNTNWAIGVAGYNNIYKWPVSEDVSKWFDICINAGTIIGDFSWL